MCLPSAPAADWQEQMVQENQQRIWSRAIVLVPTPASSGHSAESTDMELLVVGGD
jgi:hypothetical protein